MSATVAADRVLSSDQLAEACGVTTSCVSRWVTEGLTETATGVKLRLRPSGAGKRYRIRWSEYEQWQARVSPRGVAGGAPAAEPGDADARAAGAAAELKKRTKPRGRK